MFQPERALMSTAGLRKCIMYEQVGNRTIKINLSDTNFPMFRPVLADYVLHIVGTALFLKLFLTLLGKLTSKIEMGNLTK